MISWGLWNVTQEHVVMLETCTWEVVLCSIRGYKHFWR
jgi:hypothetical protein